MKRKNNITAPILSLLLFAIACNCNFTDWVKTDEPQNSSRAENTNSIIITNSERSSDSNSGNTTNQMPGAAEKTGIAECDEFISYIEQNSEEIGKDSAITRGIVEYYKQMIYGKLREGIGNSTPQEKKEVAEQCRLALEKLKEQNQPKK